jgi:hypothetical protein
MRHWLSQWHPPQSVEATGNAALAEPVAPTPVGGGDRECGTG